MKKLLLLPFILFLFSCGDDTTKIIEENNVYEEKAVEIDISEYLGSYLIAQIDEQTGEVVLVENCWSKSIEQFEISEFAGSPGEYFFVFNGHHATMYLMEAAEIKDNQLFFKGTLEDESSDKIFDFSIEKNPNGIYTLYSKSGNYDLIPAEEKKNIRHIPCEEEKEPLSDLDYMNEIFMTFFGLKEGGEKLEAFIPKEGVEIILPGGGTSLTKTIAHKAEEITATSLFNSPAYNRLLEYIQMHNNEERGFLEFVEELPDRCIPSSEALFVKTTSIEENPIIGTAMLTKMNDESEEVYTYVIVHFEYTDRMRITKIDASECGA